MPLNQKQSQQAGCAIVIVAAIGALFLGLWLAPITSQICQKNEYIGKEDCVAHNVMYVAAWSFGKALEDYSGAITGLATVLLAYITWRLVVLGREQSETTRAQLRAYLSVIFSGGLAQDSAVGLRFQGDALLKNGGQTPAYNVRWEVRAAIIRDVDLPTYNFFVLPTGTAQDTLGAGETRTISGVVPHLMNDAEIESIRAGMHQALWVWGTVQYEDIFKNTHAVRFSHRLNWIGDHVFGRSTPAWSGSD